MTIHLIEVAFDDLDERDQAYSAIERLLGEMGQIGTLSARSEPLPTIRYHVSYVYKITSGLGMGFGSVVLESPHEITTKKHFLDLVEHLKSYHGPAAMELTPIAWTVMERK